MKRLILLITFISSCFGFEEFNYDKLDNKQRELAKLIYQRGDEHSLGATLVALAWQESRLGRYPINLSDPSGSCGIFHQVVKHYLTQHKLLDTKLNRNIACGNLIYDNDLAITQAIEVLLFWKRYHEAKRNFPYYPNMIKSYNGGTKSSEASDKYYKQVYHNVKIIEGLRNKILGHGGLMTFNIFANKGCK